MSYRVPKVSIGLPVFNGEKYLEESINSILNQTYDDFELVISDNGSTDRTQRICEDFAAQDDRIRYYRNSENKGATWNFNRVFELSQGEYFKWAAHDDIISPTFLEKCVEVLNSDATIILCSSQVTNIDEHGEMIAFYDIKLRTNSYSPIIRFKDLLLKWHVCYEIFGLIRRNGLQQTPLMGNYGHADGVLLERLSLLGRFYEIPEVLFYPRLHPNQSMKVYTNYRAYADWFDPSMRGRIILPTWTILSEHISTIMKGRINILEKFLGLLSIGRWMIKQRRPLFFDLVNAFKQILDRVKNKNPDSIYLR